MNYKIIDIETWKRKAQYEFFKAYENPFYNITASVDVTELYAFAKRKKLSFFFCTLYTATAAINAIEELRTRIHGEQVRLYDTIDAGSTFLHEDQTFGYFFAEFNKDIYQFCRNCETIITKMKANKTFAPVAEAKDNVIHSSVLPWLNFTSIKHPRNIPVTDSVPKLVFGKFITENGRKVMPISFEAHHSLADGFHAGLFFSKFKEISTLLA